ncbi:acylneuraminate cytidylyltransferase [candidate division KSB1 bacterium]|nr:acylneuraminate cytidylyltransferase [candidate division KSB1 bacterium]
MIVAIIPARGGSKGLPRKNIRRIAGFPLIYWTIQAAQHARHLDAFYVSTEDDEIASVAQSYGAEVLMRPMHLAADDTTTLAVLEHHLSQHDWQSVMVLQPTSPLRNPGTIDACITEYRSGDYDTLATGYYTKIQEYATHHNLRRQDIPGFFYDDGNVYILNRRVIAAHHWFGQRICRKVLPKELNFEIDDEVDFQVVESLLVNRLKAGQQPSDFHEKLKKVKMLVMDVDGVLTNGAMYYTEHGDELKKFNTRDGMGLDLIRQLGIKTAIITAENTKLVERRAHKLKIDYVFQGIKDKVAGMDALLNQSRLQYADVAYIGDDVNDREVLRRIGVPIAVADADASVKKLALYITSKIGGDGAVREICDLIISRR